MEALNLQAILPSRHLTITCQQWKQQNNLFKVNNKDTRTTSLILTSERHVSIAELEKVASD